MFRKIIVLVFIAQSLIAQDIKQMLSDCQSNLKARKFEKALQLGEKAFITIKEQIGTDNPSFAVASYLLGQVYRHTNNFNEASLYYGTALSFFKKNKKDNLKNYINLLLDYGKLAKDMNNQRLADSLYSNLLFEMDNQKIKKNSQYADCLSHLAEIKANSKQFAIAEQMLTDANAIYEEFADTSAVKDNLHRLVKIYYHNHEFEKAEALLRRRLAINMRNFGPSSLNYAVTLNEFSEYCFINGKIKEAEDSLLSAERILTKLYKENLADIEEFMFIRNNLALVYDAQGKTDLADKIWIECFKNYAVFIRNYLLLVLDKELILTRINKYYEIFNSYAIKRKNEKPELLEIMLENQFFIKSIILKYSSMSFSKIRTSKDPNINVKFAEWQKLRKMYNEAIHKYDFSNVQTLEIELKNLERELIRISISLENISAVKEYKWKEISSALGDKEALVEIIRYNQFDRDFTGDVRYVYLILKKNSSFSELIIENDGNKLEKDYILLYKKGIAHKLDDFFKDSYYYFWVKPSALLQNISTLYVIPDGIYHQFNLETLIDEHNNFLIDKYEICLLGNASEIFDLKKSRSDKADLNKAFLFGNPRFLLKDTCNLILDEADSIQNLEYSDAFELPATKTEVLGIKSLLESMNCSASVYIRENATKGNMLACTNPSILHIATHGYYFRKSNPGNYAEIFTGKTYQTQSNPLLRSGLLLAKESIGKCLVSKKYDYDYLKAIDISAMVLDSTQLVVLSACESGLGDIMNREGVYGLQRAFLLAGAKSVITTLWSVQDKETQELMTIFYQKWLGGMTKRKALIEAKKDIIKIYKNPKYWGAFVLVGE